MKNIAISGIDTQGKYKKVCKIYGDRENDVYMLDEEYPIVYDKNGMLHNWIDQKYSHCTLYTYEDFIENFSN